MKIRLFLAILAAWCVCGGLAWAAAEQPLPSAASLAERLKPAQALEQRQLELEAKIAQAQEALRTAQQHSDPALEAGKAEIKSLQKQKTEALAGLANAKAEAMALDMLYQMLGVPLTKYFVLGMAAVLLVSCLLTLYLWIFKRDLVFKIAFGELRSSLFKTIAPSTKEPLGVKQGHYLGAFLLAVGVVAAAFILLLLWSSPAHSADNPSGPVVATWDAKQDNFEQNVDDFKYLTSSDSHKKLVFLLAHPQGSMLDLNRLNVLPDKKGIVFKRKPAVNFVNTRLSVNSFEYLFLLGRLLYEDSDKDERVFAYFNHLTDFKKVKFDDHVAAQEYMLNLLKIAFLKGRGPQFENLMATFIDYARPALRFELASFLIFEVDKAEGLKLFKHLLTSYPSQAMALAHDISAKLGPQVAYQFYSTALQEMIQSRLPTQTLVASLLKLWPELRRQGMQAQVAKDYVALLRQLLEQSVLLDGMARLLALETLVEEAEQKDFVRVQLEMLAKTLDGNVPVDAYLMAVQLKGKLGDKKESDSLLDRAYTQDYARQPSALQHIAAYCLKSGDLQRTAKVLDTLFANFQKQKESRCSDKLVSELGLEMPLPHQGISLLGFYALVNQRINNQGVCQDKMEEAAKLGLANSLNTYTREWPLNINELFYLLDIYRQQNDAARFNNVLPIYEAAAERYRQQQEPEVRQNIANLEKLLANLEQKRKDLAPTPEELAQAKGLLQAQISDLRSEAEGTITKAKVMRVMVVLTLIVSVLYGLGVLFFCASRAGHFARQACRWKMAVFILRLAEGMGFAAMLTVVMLPLGVSVVLSAQLLLRLIQDPLNCASAGPPSPPGP